MTLSIRERDSIQAEPLNEADFHAMLVATLPSLRQQAYALTRSRADADDLLQSAVTNALAARASFAAGTNFKGWMYRILRNRFFSDIRRKRETVTMEDAPQQAFARPGNQEDNLALRELRLNLARLPAEHRVALLAITVQGLSYEEASEQFGVAVGTLKCRVFRARKQLQVWMLGEDEAAEGRTAKAAARLRANVNGAGSQANSGSMMEMRGNDSRML